jgi:small subunit ribosomal protein S17
MSEKTANPRTVVGRVISDKMDKSISVRVETREQHPIYKKYVRRSSKFHAHDADNACRIGDLVRIEECRPLSKTKTWRLVEVIERAGE